MGKRRQSVNSQYSKGSGGSKRNIDKNQSQNVILTSMNKTNEFDKLKNLKSVLATRANSKNKNGSGTRQNAREGRRPPSASGTGKQNQNSGSQMNL